VNYADTADSVGVIVAILGALGVAWKKYRRERQKTMVTCPAHVEMVSRIEKADLDRSQIRDTINAQGQQIAVTVALMKELKDDVVENRRLVGEKLDSLSDQIHELSISIAVYGKR
jgi:hypothetical protein